MKSFRFVFAWLAFLMLSGSFAYAAGTTEKAAGDSGVMVLKMMRGEHPSQPIRTDSPVLAEIEKKFSIKLQINGVPSADWGQKVRTMMATNDIPDLMVLEQSDAKAFFESGIFVPVSDHFAKMPNLKKLVDKNPEVRKMYSAEGKMYSIPQFARALLTLGQFPMIRQDLMKKHNLKTPTTFGELEQTLEALKKAYPDVYPLTGRTGNILQMFSYAMGAGHDFYYDHDLAKKWVYGPTQPAFKEVVTYLNGLHKKGLLDPDYLSNTAQQWQEKLSTSRGFFSYDNYSFFPNFNRLLQNQDPNAKFAPMQTLVNSQGIRRSWFYPKFWTASYVVSSKVPNLDRTLAYMDWLYSDAGADLTNFGIEGTHYSKNGSEYIVNAELVKKHLADADPWRGYLAALTGGLLGVAGYVDERSQFAFLGSDYKTIYDTVRDDPGMRETIFPPVFNQQELDKLKELRTKLTTLVGQASHQFIMGEKPLSDFDAWVKATLATGTVQEIESIYNTAQSRVK
jgi:ABC-type glycerol-3-phosphate transport system substrate-binding protein